MSVIISSFAHVIIDLKLFAGFLLYQESHIIWHSYKNLDLYIYILNLAYCVSVLPKIYYTPKSVHWLHLKHSVWMAFTW